MLLSYSYSLLFMANWNFILEIDNNQFFFTFVLLLLIVAYVQTDIFFSTGEPVIGLCEHSSYIIMDFSGTRM